MGFTKRVYDTTMSANSTAFSFVKKGENIFRFFLNDAVYEKGFRLSFLNIAPQTQSAPAHLVAQDSNIRFPFCLSIQG